MILALQNQLKELSLLFVRLVLSYGFYEPAKTKWQDIQSVADWFSSLNIPFPLLNAYLSASFEMLGVFLLLIGLFTRWITIPLMFIMIVAIFTVHWENGFAASDNGFEIPLYYFVMLLVLLSFGEGKWSVDFYLKKRK
jgi:putative oxidoreductase